MTHTQVEEVAYTIATLLRTKWADEHGLAYSNTVLLSTEDYYDVWIVNFEYPAPVLGGAVSATIRVTKNGIEDSDTGWHRDFDSWYENLLNTAASAV